MKMTYNEEEILSLLDSDLDILWERMGRLRIYGSPWSLAPNPGYYHRSEDRPKPPV
jgi:hypothetical protein